MRMVSMKVVEHDTACMPSYDACPTIYLNEAQVKALGIAGMPEPGTAMTMEARVIVQRMEASATGEQGAAPQVCLSLKIEDMGLAPHVSEQDQASMLYGG
jgi:hypothetical protein